MATLMYLGLDRDRIVWISYVTNIIIETKMYVKIDIFFHETFF